MGKMLYLLAKKGAVRGVYDNLPAAREQRKPGDQICRATLNAEAASAEYLDAKTGEWIGPKVKGG